MISLLKLFQRWLLGAFIQPLYLFVLPYLCGFFFFFFFSIPSLLVLEDTLGPSWGLPVPALESAISPGSLVPLLENEWS